MCAAVQTAGPATPKICCVPEPPTEFVYLSVDAFQKLTPHQKQQYVEALRRHIDFLVGEDPAQPLEPQ